MDEEIALNHSEGATIEELNIKILDSIRSAANAHIPKSKERTKREQNFPPKIVECLKTRNFWAREFRKYRTEIAANKYRAAEERANSLIGAFKIKQWENFLKAQGKSPLSTIPFWKRINRLRAGKRRAKIADLTHENRTITDPREKAEIFAQELSKKFTLDENPRFDTTHKQKVQDRMAGWKTEFNTNQKKFRKLTTDELNAAIRHMNSKTSIDPLGISNKMLKNLGHEVKDHIIKLFNRCLESEQVPQIWKHSVISMILKNGQNNGLVGSYRPISMTPCLARLFERLVLQRLEVFLKLNNIIINNQSGFRKNRQTKDNLLYTIQNAQEGFNCEEKTLTIFFDVAAAFDKVWHQGLIFKLLELGVPYYLISIIEAFLENRTFTVKIEGKESGHYIIVCGVPQGGVLSPTLFSVYVNNIPIAKGEKETCLLFADDLVYQLRYKYKIKGKVAKITQTEAEKKAQGYLNLLEQWMNLWRLTLAPKKCGQLTLSRARCTEREETMNLKLYDTLIPAESNPKFLGVYFDRKLTFAHHFEMIQKKLNDRLSILKILSYDKNWALNPGTLVQIYKSLVRSVLDYASVTSIACNVNVINDYEVVQNDALRIVFKKTLMDHVKIEDLRKRAKVSSIQTRHKELLTRYYERAIMSNNPLVKEMYKKYDTFKKRHFLAHTLAVDNDNNVNLELLESIRTHNTEMMSRKETYPTTLCCADYLIRQYIFDDFSVGGVVLLSYSVGLSPCTQNTSSSPYRLTISAQLYATTHVFLRHTL